MKTELIQKINQYPKGQEIFKPSKWKERGLHPSPPEIIKRMAYVLEVTKAGLLEKIQAEDFDVDIAFPEVLTILDPLIEDDDDFDTEDREFLIDEIIEFARILNLKDFEKTISEWLQQDFPKHPNEVIVENLSKEKIILKSCKACNKELGIKIESVRSNQNIEVFLISECANCGALNLLDLPGRIHKMSTVNIKTSLYLNKKEYSRSKAEALLEKMENERQE